MSSLSHMRDVAFVGMNLSLGLFFLTASLGNRRFLRLPMKDGWSRIALTFFLAFAVLKLADVRLPIELGVDPIWSLWIAIALGVAGLVVRWRSVNRGVDHAGSDAV